MTLARTVMFWKSRMFWYVRATPRPATSWGGIWLISIPSSSMVPEVGWYTPLSWLKNVVFPAPFGPMIETIEFRGISKSMSRLATSPSKALVTARATSSRRPPAAPISWGPDQRKGAHDHARDAPHAAQHHHGQDGDGDQQDEAAGHHPLQVGGEGAAAHGADRGPHGKCQQLVVDRADARRLGNVLVLAHGVPGAPRAWGLEP